MVKFVRLRCGARAASLLMGATMLVQPGQVLAQSAASDEIAGDEILGLCRRAYNSLHSGFNAFQNQPTFPK